MKFFSFFIRVGGQGGDAFESSKNERIVMLSAKRKKTSNTEVGPELTAIYPDNEKVINFIDQIFWIMFSN